MYDTTRFATGMAVSLAVVGLVGALLVQSGTAYAVPVAGVGGFTLTADEMRAENAELYVGTGDTSTASGVPMSVTEISSAEIEGLTITRKVDVGDMPGLSGAARIVITGDGTVTTGRLLLKASEVRAGEAVVRQQTIDESPADDPSERFTVTANGTDARPGMVLRNVTIRAHYITTERITIPNQQIVVEYDPDGDGTYERRLE